MDWSRRIFLAQAGMALPGAVPDAAVGTRDHDGVVGHFGVGYMGRRSMLIDLAPGAVPVDAEFIFRLAGRDLVMGVRVDMWIDPQRDRDSAARFARHRYGVERADQCQPELIRRRQRDDALYVRGRYRAGPFVL